MNRSDDPPAPIRPSTPAFAKRLDGVGLSMIRQVMLKAAGCANLGIGEPDFASPEEVRDEAHRMLREGKILYTPNAGLSALCEAVRRHHGNHPGHAACITNGSQEALFDLFFAMLDPGDQALLPNPGFVAYETVARLAGAQPVFYRTPAEDDFAFSREEFRRALGSCKRCKLALVNSPSNPTGQILSRAEYEWVAEETARAGVLLVSDEIYGDIHFGDQPPAAVSQVTDRAVTLSGVSKMAAMTGWRVGWACGPADVIAKTTIAHQYTSSCASSLAQTASLRLFTDEGRAAVQRLRDTIRANRDFACRWIEDRLRRPFARPQGAFYLMLSVKDLGPDSQSVAMRLLEDRVATIPGAAFGSEGEGFLRLSFACQRQDLEQGLARLEAGLRRLDGGLNSP